MEKIQKKKVSLYKKTMEVREQSLRKVIIIFGGKLASVHAFCLFTVKEELRREAQGGQRGRTGG